NCLQNLVLKPTRAKSLLTLEDLSPWASLLAGAIPLGPADAPCSGETSTAQGDSLLGVMLLQFGYIKTSCCPASSSDQAILKPPPHTKSPMRPNPVKKLLSFPASLHELNPQKTITRLGLPLLGLKSENGPLKPQLPKPIRCVSTPFLIRPSSNPIYVLSKPSRWICRDYNLNGRGLHSRSISQSLLWLCFNHLRTM
ncbi:unnamed protein product, partial [Arabidopsis halleri]